MARGGCGLPPDPAVSGGSLRGVPLSLAARDHSGPGARRAAPLGGRDLVDQPAPERRRLRVRSQVKRDSNNRIAGPRFEGPASFHTAGSRWSAWSKSIVDRRLRTVLPRSAATLTLVERSSTILNVFHRWDWRMWRMTPHLRLSFGAVISEAGRHLKQTLSRATQAGLRVSQRLARNEVSRTGGIEKVLQSEGTPLSQSRLQQATTLRTAEPDDEFERTLSLRTAVSMTRRLVEERQRIELPGVRESSTLRQGSEPPAPVSAQMPARPMVALDGAPGRAAMVLNRPARTEPAVERDSSWSTTRHSGIDREPSSRVPPVPQINIEQITDHVIKQIDNRIVAFRERMGRPGI